MGTDEIFCCSHCNIETAALLTIFIADNISIYLYTCCETNCIANFLCFIKITGNELDKLN